MPRVLQLRGPLPWSAKGLVAVGPLVQAWVTGGHLTPVVRVRVTALPQVLTRVVRSGYLEQPDDVEAVGCSLVLPELVQQEAYKG